MKHSLNLLILIAFLFAGHALAQPYCEMMRGEVDIVDIPHGHAELKLTRYSPSYLQLPVTVNPYNGYYEIAPPTGNATWYLSIQYVMDPGYESLNTNGTWTFYATGSGGQQGFENQIAINYGVPCTYEDPWHWLPFYFYTRFNSSDTCVGKSISGKVRHVGTKPGLPGKQVSVNFFVSAGNPYWYYVSAPITDSTGRWTHDIVQGGTSGKCGRFRIDAPAFEWPDYGYGPGQIIADVFMSSDTVTYVGDFIRAPL